MKKKEKFTDPTVNDFELAYGSIGSFVVLIGSIAWIYLTPKGSSSYITANKTLLILDALIIMVFFNYIIFRGKLIIEKTKRILRKEYKMVRGDYYEYLYWVSFILSFVSILFVLDIEVLNKNKEIRVGSVIVLGIIQILSTLFFRKRRYRKK